MIYLVVAFFGCFLGYLIGKFTKEELKDGQTYFKILELIILFVLSLTFLYYSFEIVLFVFGIFFSIMFRKEYFYFGFGLFSSLFNNNLAFLASSLVFIYGLPYGTLLYYNKKFMSLIYSLVLFFITFIIYFLGYNMLSFAAGALISLFVLKAGKLIKGQ